MKGKEILRGEELEDFQKFEYFEGWFDKKTHKPL